MTPNGDKKGMALDILGSTGKALVSRHPRGVKKVSITGAGRLRECENSEFAWEFNKMEF